MKILIAVEDKQYTNAIAQFVCTHGTWPGEPEFRIINVVEPLYMGAITGYSNEILLSYAQERQRAGLSLVLSIGTQLKQQYPCAKVQEEVLEGHPKEVIVDTAKSWNADLIIVGSHGRSGISQFLLGSVSMSVLSVAPCSVMIVKLPHEPSPERAKETASCVSTK